VPIDLAKSQGATALFGEKYGDQVRVITFDPNFSVELCGGTHVASTGMIGHFKIVSEGSISSGVRRIEAITSDAADAYIQQQLGLIRELEELLKNPVDLKKSIESLLQERNDLKREIESLHAIQSGIMKGELIRKAELINGVHCIFEQVALPSADALKKLAFELKNELEQALVVLAADVDGKPQIAVIIDESLVTSRGLNAGNAVRELAKEIQGGGGGQPFFATAGGKNLAGLPEVIVKARQMFADI
jgi:alanyl-tRNA synthetase